MSAAPATLYQIAAAHKYAVETYNGTFTKEDVRSLVLSVFIQNGKSTGGR